MCEEGREETKGEDRDRDRHTHARTCVRRLMKGDRERGREGRGRMKRKKKNRQTEREEQIVHKFFLGQKNKLGSNASQRLKSSYRERNVVTCHKQEAEISQE